MYTINPNTEYVNQYAHFYLKLEPNNPAVAQFLYRMHSDGTNSVIEGIKKRQADEQASEAEINRVAREKVRAFMKDGLNILRLEVSEGMQQLRDRMNRITDQERQLAEGHLTAT